jgi:probable rRNA maturation factor
MKLNLEVNNVTQSPVADSFFVAVAERALAKAEYAFLQEKNISISLAVVAPAEIKKLNGDYRKYDSVTDVLSFAEYENLELLEKAAEGEDELFLGELIICYDDIKEYCRANSIDLEKELANVTAHGVLHLLGFDHSDKMFSLQAEIIK